MCAAGQPGLRADRLVHCVAGRHDALYLSDRVGQQGTQSAHPDLRPGQVSLRDRLVLLYDALIGQHAFTEAFRVDLGDPLGAAQRGHRRQQCQCGHHRPAVGAAVV